MRSVIVDLDGAETVDAALERFSVQMAANIGTGGHERRPLLDLKLTGRVAFHPFELGRERLKQVLEELRRPLHTEIRNHLSLVTRIDAGETLLKSLFEIERDVLRGLVSAGSAYRGQEESWSGWPLRCGTRCSRERLTGRNC